MNDGRSTWLGRRCPPRDLSGFEIEERRALEIALALRSGFLPDCATAGSCAAGAAGALAAPGSATRWRRRGSTERINSRL